MNEELLKYAAGTVERLKAEQLLISCAESCTGGLLSALITTVPGASTVFELSVCTYSPRFKTKILGVKPETLQEKGAVSRDTAAQMAAGIRLLSGADIGISITGAAGPDAADGKEPGTVYIALSDGKSVRIEKLQITYESRVQTQEAAVLAMFDFVNQYLEKRRNTQ